MWLAGNVRSQLIVHVTRSSTLIECDVPTKLSEWRTYSVLLRECVFTTRYARKQVITKFQIRKLCRLGTTKFPGEAMVLNVWVSFLRLPVNICFHDIHLLCDMRSWM